jgi:ADP-dependent NAD(P)H-hydrate dehydratase / NAD(P)H-hydrate epimerase
MAALERGAYERHGIEVAALMERAGARTAEVARGLLRERGGRGVVVLAGKGNNGGDGLVAARHLVGDARVAVILTTPADEMRGEPAAHLAALRGRGVDVIEAGTLPVEALDRRLAEADLLVDAIFGTGFRGPAQGVPARAIDAANRSGTPILAVDIPSGADAGSGSADPPVIRAVATVAMALPKIGILHYPAAAVAGRLFIADIGIPWEIILAARIPSGLATAGWVNHTIPRRPSDSHKGAFGHVLVVAGARGFAGAAVLASRGAIRAGAGLVTTGIVSSLAGVVTASLPEAMTHPLPETPAGTLAAGAADAILDTAASFSVVAIGPGLTTHPEVAAMVRRLLSHLEHPIVMDADALNVLAGSPAPLRDAKGPIVITPHPGEMGRLLGRSTSDVQRDRMGAAREAARVFGVIAVLKGARTVVASPDGRALIVPTGNAGMATGGMGDVLTGMAAALLGQHLDPFDAAACAAYLHGLAGDLMSASRGELGILAHEVADEIPQALAAVRSARMDDGLRFVS